MIDEGAHPPFGEPREAINEMGANGKSEEVLIFITGKGRRQKRHQVIPCGSRSLLYFVPPAGL